MQWPNNKSFAFTVFDDTDNSTIATVKPVYDLLRELNFRTTKSVWVYDPRGRCTGQSLSDPAYLAWVKHLQAEGFEIGLHNVGDGKYLRDEIIQGIELFHELLGYYPRIHTNHGCNPDNIYWYKDRFDWPYSVLYSIYSKLFKQVDSESDGTNENSPYFWGDICKQHIHYIRNYACRNVNTLSFNPSMPYIDSRKEAFSNRWFSSSDGQTVKEFCDLLRPECLEQLIAEKGACIVYTHFASGFVDAAGKVDARFRQRMEHLASLDGFFEPASTVLDHLKSQQKINQVYIRPSTGHWLRDRIIKKFRYGR